MSHSFFLFFLFLFLFLSVRYSREFYSGRPARAFMCFQVLLGLVMMLGPEVSLRAEAQDSAWASLGVLRMY